MDGTASAPDQDGGPCERPRESRATLIVYFDTSAFFKLFVAEVGSAEAAATWDAADRRLSTRLLYVEARAALRVAVRERRVLARELDEVRAQLELLWDGVDPIEVDHAVVSRAGDLADEHALRAYDAVHLASAEAVADDETWFVAADRTLLEAAENHGLATLTLVE